MNHDSDRASDSDRGSGGGGDDDIYAQLELLENSLDRELEDLENLGLLESSSATSALAAAAAAANAGPAPSSDEEDEDVSCGSACQSKFMFDRSNVVRPNAIVSNSDADFRGYCKLFSADDESSTSIAMPHRHPGLEKKNCCDDKGRLKISEREEGSKNFCRKGEDNESDIFEPKTSDNNNEPEGQPNININVNSSMMQKERMDISNEHDPKSGKQKISEEMDNPLSSEGQDGSKANGEEVKSKSIIENNIKSKRFRKEGLSREGFLAGSGAIGSDTSPILSNKSDASNVSLPAMASSLPTISKSYPLRRRLRRRRKRFRRISPFNLCKGGFTTTTAKSTQIQEHLIKKKRKSKLAKNGAKLRDLKALITSLIGGGILVFVVMDRVGFRSQAMVVGIDLGTSNSVVCIHAPSKGVDEVICVSDPATGSPVVPSVVSFLDNHYMHSLGLIKEEKYWTWRDMAPHAVEVVVGQAAKDRISRHPRHTVYHSMHIIGREYGHQSVRSLKSEVNFDIVSQRNENGRAAFSIPYYLPSSSALDTAVVSPSEIGSYIIHYLRSLVRDFIKHDKIQSTVIAVPTKFDFAQHDATVLAFKLAGLKTPHILEKPIAVALAYGLHKRDDAHHVVVYDFGGGKLDISVLFLGEGGYIDVLGSDCEELLGGTDFDAAVAHWLLEKKGGKSIVKTIMASVARIEEGMVGNGSETVFVEDLIQEQCPDLKKVPLCTLSSFHLMAERMKIELSGHPYEPEVSAEDTCYRLRTMELHSVPSTAEELCEKILQVKLSLTLKEYNMAVEHLLDRSVLPIQRLLKHLNLQKEDIDDVVMVGGTTRMPQIREMVRQSLGKERLNTSIDPDLAAAYGAATVID